MNILLLDLPATGHHPRCLRWIVDSEGCRNSTVYLAGRPELLQHVELKSAASRIHSFPISLRNQRETLIRNTSSATALVRRQFMMRQLWREVYEEISCHTRIDLVFLAYADDCLDAIGMAGAPFGKTPWAGITFRPMFHLQEVGVLAPLPRFSTARQWLFRRALRESHLAGLFTIDPTLMEFAASHFDRVERQRLRFLPDPVVHHELEPHASARAALAIPSDAIVVLAYGALSERKGICSLVDSAASDSCPANIHVVLAGRQEKEIETYLQGSAAIQLRSQNRLHVFAGYQTDKDEARLLASADCMWVGYREFYLMSGILLLAAHHGIPCLVSQEGIAGYLAEKHKLGLIVKPDEASSVLEALNRIAASSKFLSEAGANGRTAFQKHSVGDFQREITELLSASTRRRPKH